MAVYVDDMFAGYGRMTMCHMIADSLGELVVMAARIGVDQKWIQSPGTYREHFDICKAKRTQAVNLGAVEVTQRELVTILLKRKNPPPAAGATRENDTRVAARKGEK